MPLLPMEANFLSKFNQAVNENDNGISASVNPQAQAIALSLITNPYTCTKTLTSIFQTLTSRSELPGSITHPHILALLSALVRHHPDFRGQVCSIICSHYVLPSTPIRLLIDALSILFAINDGDSCVIVDESLFLSLCFRPCKASLRKWLLQNAFKFSVRPSVLLTVMLGFTKDPYPQTRKAALDGLILLCDCVEIEDSCLVEGCYSRAVELLFDSEDYVRCSAVRAVSKLGASLVVSNHEKSEIDWSDAIFLQLCTMARDMSMCVRVEAFEALGRVRMVSEYILLQTLSKKATPATKDKSYQGQYSGKVLNLPAAAAAFAFVHGLEDEYYEVRRSACHALRNLTDLSAKFTGQAVNYLMDVLNDDSVTVRVEVLQTMHQIALCGHLKVEEEHLHMFLGTLTDSNSLVRSVARRSLRLIKLSKLSLFRSCIEGFTRSLEVYPQDEADVLSAMFKIGQGHGKFVTSVIQEAAERMEPSLEFAFGFDEMKTAALLVLAISAPVSLEHHICTIPPRIYSYAVTMLGRMSHGLADIVTQSTLLFVLSLNLLVVGL
ncbi:hypothetical protein Leryth_004806 [Lithospermum erythrorhizon]|nr:hypothetical protein Leryth_004806 [Lithospermum erythrorhizon]